MTSRERGIKIQQQILRDIKYHPNDIAQHISDIFQITRQATHKHLKKLEKDNWLVSSGSTRNKVYRLGSRREHSTTIELNKNTSEHDVYDREFYWVIEGLPKNIEDIIYYGFTEMVNNAIDHSEGSTCLITLSRTANNITIFIQDNGEGIFKRITRIKQLSDEKQAILELYKGKLTTDPSNHSGQGIFFTSKMFDEFAILSENLIFRYSSTNKLEYISDYEDLSINSGTAVHMQISSLSKRKDSEVFDMFSGNDEENYAFNKTVIPVSMARINKENLVSRSQAKRLLIRVENFKYVLFDFKGVESIGQAFADEIFRVYQLRYPDILITTINACDKVLKMINRALVDVNQKIDT